MTEPIDIRQEQHRREKAKYRAAVLEAWNRLDHLDKRQQQEKKAEVERKARQRW